MDFEDVRNDFEVEYRFVSREEGGRETGPPAQGLYRCDWVYADVVEEDPGTLWMIWPIFINESGEPLPRGTLVTETGLARMVILNDDLRETVHKNRIKLGVRGYFVEGVKKVAEAVVVRVVDLDN